MSEHIERPEYLEWLKQWKEQQIIKVVSGVRRCGKSTLFEIYKDWLKNSGVFPSSARRSACLFISSGTFA